MLHRRFTETSVTETLYWDARYRDVNLRRLFLLCRYLKCMIDIILVCVNFSEVFFSAGRLIWHSNCLHLTWPCRVCVVWFLGEYVSRSDVCAKQNYINDGNLALSKLLTLRPVETVFILWAELLNTRVLLSTTTDWATTDREETIVSAIARGKKSFLVSLAVFVACVRLTIAGCVFG